MTGRPRKPVNLRLMKHQFCELGWSYIQVAEFHNVSPALVKRRRKSEGWLFRKKDGRSHDRRIKKRCIKLLKAETYTTVSNKTGIPRPTLYRWFTGKTYKD